jgi:hypothetical protein
MLGALRRRAAHNGFELSCRASRIRFRSSRSPLLARSAAASCYAFLKPRPGPTGTTFFHRFLHPLAPAASRLPYRATVLDLGPPLAALPPRPG